MDNKFAAVCGLYCGACTWFIATTEDPTRLKRLSIEMHFSEKESKCFGCKSDKRLPYCENCKIFACASERGIDFCCECSDFPCTDLKKFHASMPHRLELLSNLERIRSIGYANWLKEVRSKYTCPKCQTINSTYDLKCRKCGEEPCCSFVAKHKQTIEQYLNKK